MRKYATIEKQVGETPLQATARLRELCELDSNIPLAYAGRLDPMASGTLLVLIGDECKKQEAYHTLDKEYTFEILFGVRSDTGDVLGLISECEVMDIAQEKLEEVMKSLIGSITLPYPHFSAKTVRGKPLHMWTLENRLSEIEIPSKQSTIYSLKLNSIRTVPTAEVYAYVTEKIETIPTVTEESKALGKDFRRVDVRKGWSDLLSTHTNNGHTYQIATITCICSSGTYMRSLAEVIATELGTCGLAYSIHRNTIGKYLSLGKHFGFWIKKF